MPRVISGVGASVGFFVLGAVEGIPERAAEGRSVRELVGRVFGILGFFWGFDVFGPFVLFDNNNNGYYYILLSKNPISPSTAPVVVVDLMPRMMFLSSHINNVSFFISNSTKIPFFALLEKNCFLA